MKSVWISLILTLSYIHFSEAALVTLNAVEWKSYKTLYNYKTYGSITLVRVDVPAHTLMVNLTLNALGNNDRCSVRKVYVYSNQDGIPVVSRDKEAFPKNFHTPNFVPNITISTNNKTNHWILSKLHEGTLFVMAILPHDDTRIRQKGLFTQCNYFISMRAVVTYYDEESFPILTNKETKVITAAGQSKTLIGLKIPPDTLSFEVKIPQCENKDCNIKISLWQALSPEMWEDKESEVCTKPCTIEKTFPYTESFAYIGLNILSEKDESISATLILNTCTQNGTNQTNSILLANDLTTECVLPLNRYTPPYSGGYQDHFVEWDQMESKPSKKVSVEVPEDTLHVMRFKLRTSDTGGTLNIQLARPGKSKSQNVELMLCASLSRIVHASNCSAEATIKIDSDFKEKKTIVIIPYPQGALWYISLLSHCYNGSSNDSAQCLETPRANITMSMSSCVDGRCGDHGECKMYTGDNILYTACDCNSGWRGYSCNDGNWANSLAMQKVAVYLLTFSNLGFIPGICLALHRRYFVEAFVYSFNMFFSTFYHACDSSYVYKLCIWPWGTLIFADFFASLMSFAVTLLAMARIPIGLRSFFQMAAAMFIAVAEVHDRHGLVEQLVPIASGLSIVAVSWGYEMYKRKSLFPSKRRYLIFIAPGLSLAVLGLCLNLAVETNDNYKYVHSAWHILVASAIVFLLPPRSTKKWCSEEQPLSIQSGDVMTPSPDLFDSNRAGFQNADDPNPTPVATESTALNNGGNFLLTHRSGSRQSYAL